jgi:formiminoglutamase
MSHRPYLKRAGTAIFQDRFVRKGKELFQGEASEAVVALVGAPLSKSSISHSGAAFAPNTIRQALQAFSTYAVDDDIDLWDERGWDAGDVEMHPTDIVTSQQRIYDTLVDLYKSRPETNWIVLGGDHSISYPSIHAFQQAYGTIGVIQFDAHHDLRNLQDGGPTNGTPFRSLLEKGALQGKHLIQIGIRNFMNGKSYTEFGQQQGVTIYTMKDVREQGVKELVSRSVEQLATTCDRIYVSVDMDVLDQAFAPGCPAIGPGGMDSESLIEAIELVAQHEKVKGMDIVEIDPTVDVRDMTSRMAAYLILTFWKGKKKIRT